MRGYLKKLSPYMVVKGFRYLRHFGLKEFWIRLCERMEPEEVPYGPWYEEYRPTPEELDRQRRFSWGEKPVVFSVIVPVYRTPGEYLTRMLQSVQDQTYPHWELCIANADPSCGEVSAILARRKADDGRIRVLELEKNGGIAENTNAAISLAKGDFLVFLDHDDELSPAALYQLARCLKAHPAADLLYTDEDKVTADGSSHFQPHFKPDFNLDLLRSNNYICHLLAVRSDLARSLGGLRSAFDGAQDYDFILRCAEQAEEICHVPEILYHWRTHAASTADNPVSKQYAYENGRKAIEEHLSRCGQKGQVTLLKDMGFYRVSYPVEGTPLVSILIPNKDEPETLKKCLESIWEKTTWPRYEILVLENNSTMPETLALYKSIQGKNHTRVLRWKKPFNYAAINNFGKSHAEGDYIVCLNNDVEVITPGWIEEFLGVCQRPDVGAAGARLYYPDQTIQHAGIVIGIGGVAGSMFTGMKKDYTGYLHKAALMQDLSAVTAACMMVRRDVWEKTDGFDEKLAVAFNDVDFCLRIGEAGYRVVYDPYVEMIHWESKTRGAEDSPEKVRRFQQEIELMRTRWNTILREGDPYYNKNLSLHKWNYSLKPKERMR